MRKRLPEAFGHVFIPEGSKYMVTSVRYGRVYVVKRTSLANKEKSYYRGKEPNPGDKKADIDVKWVDNPGEATSWSKDSKAYSTASWLSTRYGGMVLEDTDTILQSLADRLDACP